MSTAGATGLRTKLVRAISATLAIVASTTLVVNAGLDTLTSWSVPMISGVAAVLVSVVLGWRAALRITRPVAELEEQIRALRAKNQEMRLVLDHVCPTTPG